MSWTASKAAHPLRLAGISRALVAGAILAGALTLRAETVVEKTAWRGIDAVRLSDGRTEAVIVPKLGGRLVHYGFSGGDNWIWTGPPGAEKEDVPLMWGGDKTYIGPHTLWRYTLPKSWPPPAPDAAPHEAHLNPERLAPASPRPLLRTTSPEWPGYGARVVRDYAFENGELVITHRLTKAPGNPALGAVWVITQTRADAKVFVPLNPQSPYKDGVFWFGFGAPKEKRGAKLLSPALLEITPITGAGWKLGADPKQPALAAVKDGVAFVQQSDRQEGQYPEGADAAGLSVEVYHHDQPPPRQYTELELLSPLRRMDEGAVLVTRWNLHRLQNADDPAEIESLLTAPSGGKR